jgi:hypothetical protein
MSQGTWRVLKKAKPTRPVQRVPKVVEPKAPETSVTAVDDEDDYEEKLAKYEDKLEDWEDDNSKAVGSMQLRLHHTIQFKYRDSEKAGELWDDIKEEYGVPGKTAIYLEFKAVLDTHIPAHTDPIVAIDKMDAHFGRMEQSLAPVPDYLQCMIVLAKLSPTMESIASLIGMRDADPHSVPMSEIRKMIALNWDQRSGKTNQNQKNNQVHKISAVKRGPETPGFSQQQESNQQQEEGSDRGQGR